MILSLSTLPSPSTDLAANLEFIDVRTIRPHEIYAPGHKHDLVKCLKHEGILRHPVIATRVAPSQLVLLDGTHRLRCLESLGCGSALVQTVDLRNTAAVALGTWAHLVRIEEDLFLGDLDASELALERTALDMAEESLARREAVAWFGMYGEKKVWMIKRSAQLSRDLRTLVALYEYYKPSRIVLERNGRQDVNLDAIFKESRHYNLLVRFAPLSSSAIPDLADDPIPAGITRLQVTSGRILGVNVPLEFLKTRTLTSQWKWLAEFRHRIAMRYRGPVVVGEPTGPRFYAEDVISYDPMLVVTQALD